MWGGGSPGAARERHRAGAEVVAWPGLDERTLFAPCVPVAPALDRIGAPGRAAVDAAPRTFARLFGRVPLLDGLGFRDLLTWNEGSLLWLTEDFVLHRTAGPRCAAMAETALRILEVTGAGEVDAVSLPPPAALLLARACTARGVLFHGTPPSPPPLVSAPRRRSFRLRALVARARLPSELSGRGGESGGGAPILVLVGPGASASGLEPLVAAARRELGRPVVSLGRDELRRGETRHVLGEVARATDRLEELRGRLRGSPGLASVYAHRGVSFADLAAHDLDAVVRERLPEAVLLLETADAVLSRLRPATVVAAGFPRDDRRCLLAAAARSAVSALALHVGERDARDVDRADGGPQAASTLEWTPGEDPAPVLARLAEHARASLEPA